MNSKGREQGNCTRCYATWKRISKRNGSITNHRAHCNIVVENLVLSIIKWDSNHKNTQTQMHTFASHGVSVMRDFVFDCTVAYIFLPMRTVISTKCLLFFTNMVHFMLRTQQYYMHKTIVKLPVFARYCCCCCCWPHLSLGDSTITATRPGQALWTSEKRQE